MWDSNRRDRRVLGLGRFCTSPTAFGFLCARTMVGEVECWDDGDFPAVVAVPQGDHQQLWCGNDSACATGLDGRLTCWGQMEREPL